MSGLKDSSVPAEARYKVGEVCKQADVQPYVLRYWESEFPVLAPPKGLSGPRTYSATDLRIIERIKRLLYDEGYTIAGAKKRLESELREPIAAAPEPANDLLPLDVPPPPQEATGRVKRPRSRPVPPPLPVEPSLVFEETISEPPGELELEPPPAEKPAPGESTKPVRIDRTPAPVVQPADPRVARALTELKELLVLLSREEPEAT